MEPQLLWNNVVSGALRSYQPLQTYPI